MSVADVLKTLGPPGHVHNDFYGKPERKPMRQYPDLFNCVQITRGGMLGRDLEPRPMHWSTDLVTIEVVYQRGRVAVMHFTEFDANLWDCTSYLAVRAWQWLSPKLPPRH
jgi:hypothetical protein